MVCQLGENLYACQPCYKVKDKCSLTEANKAAGLKGKAEGGKAKSSKSKGQAITRGRTATRGRAATREPSTGREKPPAEGPGRKRRRMPAMVAVDHKKQKPTTRSSTNRRRASTPAENRVSSNIRGKRRKHLSGLDYSWLIMM